MDTRIFCLVIDARGRYRVSCRDADLDRVSPREYIASFNEAYATAGRFNRSRLKTQRLHTNGMEPTKR